MKRVYRIALVASGMVAALLVQTPTLRAQAVAELSVSSISGPTELSAGLSGTFKVTIENNGSIAAPIELHIIFAGAIDQTDRIVAGAGLACEVLHDAGINAAVRCTGGQIAAGGAQTIIVQGRGQTAGVGKLVATINASGAVQEFGGDPGNNLRQFNVTIK